MKPGLGEVAELADGFNAGAEVDEFGDGEVGVGVVEAGGALADVDEAVFVAIDQGAEEYAADEGEDGGVGADAEGESEDDGGGEAFGVG